MSCDSFHFSKIMEDENSDIIFKKYVPIFSSNLFASVEAKTNAPCTCPPLVLLSGKTAIPAYSAPELFAWLNLPFLVKVMKQHSN